MVDVVEKEKKTPVVLDEETKQKVADAVESESVDITARIEGIIFRSTGLKPGMMFDSSVNLGDLAAALVDVFDLEIPAGGLFYSSGGVNEVIEYMERMVKSGKTEVVHTLKPASELTEAELFIHKDDPNFNNGIEIPKPHDMKAAIVEERVCGSCNFHGPREAPLLFIIGVDMPKPEPRKRGLVLPNRMAKAAEAPQPVKQPMIQGCTCENPDSPQYQRIVTVKCSCPLFMDIPSNLALPEKTIVDAGGKIGKKMDQHLN